ncbi:hypothetical protein [Helicobacter vulpis]|uniref:hypothetical protein n=1 Tax=Helicobacter vulpis TaxID=2316076 RepID=UPI000EAF59E6|nr:hypothetical protein [Helicobacter vulpis]
MKGLTQAALDQGFVSNALGKPHRYDLRFEDQINLTGLLACGVSGVVRAQGLEESHKRYKEHSVEQIKSVFKDALDHKTRVLKFYGDQKLLVENCKSLKELEAFVIQEMEDQNGKSAQTN